MDYPQIGAVLVAGGSLLGILLAYFKYKPGQRERAEMDTAEGTLNLAEGTMTLVTSTLEAQFKRMAARMEEIEAEFNQYRADSESLRAELTTALRAEKADNEILRHERDSAVTRASRVERESQAEVVRLRQRVDELESEVRRLVANQS